MKTFADLLAAVNAGQRPVVTFAKGIVECDGYAEAGMRARIVSAVDQRDDCIKIVFDFSGFDEHNKSFETAGYFDKDRNPTLTARQAGYYKPQDDYYFTPSDYIAGHFTFESSERFEIYERWKASGSTAPYVSWLEDELMARQGSK